MYIMNEEGFLVSITDFVDQEDGITITAKTNIVADLGMGRPLGGQFAEDNTLYIADSHLGLTRLRNPGSGSKVELVASRVFDQGEWTQILYANDVAVGPESGTVYFTDCKWPKMVSRISFFLYCLTSPFTDRTFLVQ